MTENSLFQFLQSIQLLQIYDDLNQRGIRWGNLESLQPHEIEVLQAKLKPLQRKRFDQKFLALVEQCKREKGKEEKYMSSLRNIETAEIDFVVAANQGTAYTENYKVSSNQKTNPSNCDEGGNVNEPNQNGQESEEETQSKSDSCGSVFFPTRDALLDPQECSPFCHLLRNSRDIQALMEDSEAVLFFLTSLQTAASSKSEKYCSTLKSAKEVQQDLLTRLKRRKKALAAEKLKTGEDSKECSIFLISQHRGLEKQGTKKKMLRFKSEVDIMFASEKVFLSEDARKEQLRKKRLDEAKRIEEFDLNKKKEKQKLKEVEAESMRKRRLEETRRLEKYNCQVINKPKTNFSKKCPYCNSNINPGYPCLYKYCFNSPNYEYGLQYNANQYYRQLQQTSSKSRSNPTHTSSYWGWPLSIYSSNANIRSDDRRDQLQNRASKLDSTRYIDHRATTRQQYGTIDYPAITQKQNNRDVINAPKDLSYEVDRRTHSVRKTEVYVPPTEVYAVDHRHSHSAILSLAAVDNIELQSLPYVEQKSLHMLQHNSYFDDMDRGEVQKSESPGFAADSSPHSRMNKQKRTSNFSQEYYVVLDPSLQQEHSYCSVDNNGFYPSQNADNFVSYRMNERGAEGRERAHSGNSGRSPASQINQLPMKN